MTHSFQMLALAGAVILSGQAAWAGDFKAPATDLAGIEAGTYVLDATHASVIWHVSHLGFSQFAGRFDKMTATAKANGEKLGKSGVVVNIDPASAATGVAKLDDELKSPMFFDAAKYPNITFTSTKVDVTGKTADGKPTGKIYGTLLLHGVEKPVVLDAVFNGHGVSPFGGGPRIGFNATGKLKRSDFGVAALLPMVGDEVTFDIAAEFTKAD